MSDAKAFTSRKFDWCDGVAIDPRLTRAAIFKVAYCIAQHVNEKTGTAILSDEVIREKTNISIPMVKRHRVALRDAGWLKWQTKKGANFYTLDYGPLDRTADLATMRREARKELQEVRKKRRLEVSPVTLPEDCEVSPVIPDKSDEVSPVSYLEVSPVTLPEVSPVSHIHISSYTFTDTHSQEGLSKKEEVVVEVEGSEQEIVTEETDDLTEAMSTSVDRPAADLAGADLSNTLGKTEARADLPVIESLAEMSGAPDKMTGNAFPDLSCAQDISGQRLSRTRDNSGDESSPSSLDSDQPSRPADLSAVADILVAADVPHAAQITEQPLPAVPHEPLAEMRLFDELGEGDPDRGCQIAAAIGRPRFDWLRRELMRGTLYLTAVRAAAHSVNQVPA